MSSFLNAELDAEQRYAEDEEFAATVDRLYALIVQACMSQEDTRQAFLVLMRQLSHA